MTDTEGRTSKLAAAIARSGQTIAPEAQGTPQRRALPMNGTILAGGPRARPMEARGLDVPKLAEGAVPPPSVGSADEDAQYDRAAAAPARRVRSSGRSRALWIGVLVFVFVAGAVAALSLWLGGGPEFAPEFAEQDTVGSGAPAASVAAISHPDDPVPAQGAVSEPAEAAVPADERPATAGTSREVQDVGDTVPAPLDIVARPAASAQSPAPADTPSIEAMPSDVLSGPARAVAAVVPAGPLAVRRTPVTAPVAESTAGLPTAPRAQPSVVTGTEPPPTAPLSEPPASSGDPAPEASRAEAAFEAPHNIILHYNPATAAAAEEADRLAAALTEAGAEDVTVATVPFTISSTHLRQYHAGDASLARTISEEAGNGIEIRDFTDYSPRPAPGLIEVWIASG